MPPKGHKGTEWEAGDARNWGAALFARGRFAGTGPPDAERCPTHPVAGGTNGLCPP